METARYLLALLAEAQRVVEEHEAFGSVALRSKVMELLGAVNTVAELRPTPEAKAKWREKAGNLMLVVLGAMGTRALDVGQAVATNMILPPENS